MTPSRHVKPITQNGEAGMALRDVTGCEETPASLSLLKILALGQRQVEAQQVEAASDVFVRLRGRK